MSSSHRNHFPNPTSDPSSQKMPRSSSQEPAKSSSSGSGSGSGSGGGSKRKGTRSVSTLTPSQLARKRANDREAQRAIRARTKEHIERLEKELETLRGQHSRDQTVQELLRRNRALEEELRRLKETMGVPTNTSPYSTPGTASASSSAANSSMDVASVGALDGASSLTASPFTVYDEPMSAGNGTGPSPSRASPFPGSYDGSLQDYGASYVPIPDSSNSHSNSGDSSWNTMTNGVHSTGSSPSSSAEDYNTTAYIPTSMPNGLMPSTAPNGSVKMEYEDNGSEQDVGFPPPHLSNDLLQVQLQQQQQHLSQRQHNMLGHSSSSSMSSPDQPPRTMPWAAQAQPVFPMFFPQQQPPVH